MTQSKDTSTHSATPDPSKVPTTAQALHVEPRWLRVAAPAPNPTSAYQRRVAEILRAGGAHARAMARQLESERAELAALASGNSEAFFEQMRFQERLLARFCRIGDQQRLPSRSPRATRRPPSSAPATSAREQIRRNSVAHQTQGPPPPLLEAIDSLARALAVLREEWIAANSTPPKDEQRWIGQRESPLPPRVHTRLCRELIAQGDPRAAIRSRIHYLQQSAITGHLRGQPAPRPKECEMPRQLSAGERLRLELEGADMARRAHRGAR